MIALTTVGLTGCSPATAYEKVEPYELIATDDDRNLVVLTPQSADKLQLETAPVTEETLAGQQWLAVPYAALIYDTTGGTWVYVQPEPLSYVRAEVAVHRIEGDLVYLSDGPEPGVPVAVTSVSELYGADTGVGK